MTMLQTILNYDKAISLFITSIIPHNLFFNSFFSFFSLKGYAIFIWLVILGVLFFIDEKRDKYFFLYFFVSFILTAVIVSYPLKYAFHRPRPVANIAYHLTNSCPKDFSFPSGHAATAFAAATILTYYDRKRRKFYYLIAVLISLSRIYLQCHFFLDVIGGALVGTLISKLILYFHTKTLNKANSTSLNNPSKTPRI